MNKPKVMLIVLDGWGYSKATNGNAILQARKPTFDFFWNNYAHTLLSAFGENVGLPWGIIGSSEVGHASMGSGKLLNQELSRIDHDIQSENIIDNQALFASIRYATKSGGSMHLVGLLSDGGVHSHERHLYALLEILKKKKFKNNIFIHIFTDGRDTGMKSAQRYIKALQEKIASIGSQAQIATLCGRYFGMDRNSNWDRTKKAYLNIVNRTGAAVSEPLRAVEDQYAKNLTDEFLEPVAVMVVDKKKTGIFGGKKTIKNEDLGKILSGDSVLLFNFRSERMRQISELLLFSKKEIGTEPIKNISVTTLTTYNSLLPVGVMYPTEIITNPLAKVLSDRHMTQAHFAETEKYAHATYFFDGENAKPFAGEQWFLLPSPKVSTYDLKPEMSAKEIVDKILEVSQIQKLDFIMINFANADMVGHTGNFEATVRAVETIDEQLKRLSIFLPETTMIIVADHGNAESMVSPTGQPDKNHTVNPVPFIIVNPQFQRVQNDATLKPTGILADIAPTILRFYGIDPVPEMTGQDLTQSLR